MYVGGQSATSADFTTAVEAKLPWFLLTIIGLSFLLLVIAFRSRRSRRRPTRVRP